MTNERFIREAYRSVHGNEFNPPCRYFIRDATGDYVFIKINKRNKAPELVDEEYGSGKYKVSDFLDGM